MNKMIIVFLLIHISVINAIPIDLQCTTPRGQLGTCMLLRECPYFYELIANLKGKLTSEETLEIRQSWCGVLNRQYQICCPIEVTTTSITPTIEEDEEDESPLLHPNINLLSNEMCGFIGDNRMSPGKKTEPFENPWIAIIELEVNGTFYSCTGSIINKRYILTAAHCIHPESFVIFVVLGEHNKKTLFDCNRNGRCTTPNELYEVEEVITHPDYNSSQLINDIGLIRLKEDINFTSENIRPICLPINPSMLEINLPRVKVTGWEQAENTNISHILVQAILNIIPNNVCQTFYEKRITLTSKHMCANNEDAESCYGDSGGPTISPALTRYGARFIQFGIISAGYDSCNILPGLYTKVGPYMNWILNTIYD